MKSTAGMWHRITENMLFLPSMALLLLLVADFFLIPGFFNLDVRDGHLYGNLVDILLHGSPTIILAMGMTLVIATGGVDLSVGAIMAISSSVACLMINPTIVGMNLTDPQQFINNPQLTWMPLPLVVIVPLIVATGFGLWNGALVAYGRVQPMVATLVLMLAGRGFAQLITNAIQIVIFNDTFNQVGRGYVFLPISLYIAVAIFIVAWLITWRSSIGLMIQSVGINFRSSFYSGINEKRVKLFAYAFCGFCAGVAGLIAAADHGTSDASSIGLYTELDAILAVVIGGTLMTGGRFSYLGSAIGAVILQTTIVSMYNFGVPASVVIFVKALVVIIVILLYAEQVKGALQRFGSFSFRTPKAQEASR